MEPITQLKDNSMMFMVMPIMLEDMTMESEDHTMMSQEPKIQYMGIETE